MTRCCTFADRLRSPRRIDEITRNGRRVERSEIPPACVFHVSTVSKRMTKDTLAQGSHRSTGRRGTICRRPDRDTGLIAPVWPTCSNSAHSESYAGRRDLRCGLLDLAADRVRQHQCAGVHDRREGIRHESRRRSAWPIGVEVRYSPHTSEPGGRPVRVGGEDRALDNCSEFPIKLEVRRVVSVSAPVGSRDAALEPPWMGSRRGAETLTALRTHAYVKWNSEQLSSFPSSSCP